MTQSVADLESKPADRPILQHYYHWVRLLTVFPF